MTIKLGGYFLNDLQKSLTFWSGADSLKFSKISRAFPQCFKCIRLATYIANHLLNQMHFADLVKKKSRQGIQVELNF